MSLMKRSSYKKDARRLKKRKQRKDVIHRRRHELRYSPRVRTKGWRLGL